MLLMYRNSHLTTEAKRSRLNRKEYIVPGQNNAIPRHGMMMMWLKNKQTQSLWNGTSYYDYVLLCGSMESKCMRMWEEVGRRKFGEAREAFDI